MLQSIVRMALTAGLQVLESRGQTMEAIKTDAKARDRFIRGCHRGYDKAQQKIGAEVIELHNQISRAESELAEHRERKDPNKDKVRSRIVILRNRQLALRRVVDTILHIITFGETWVLRRLILENRIFDIDSAVLKKTLELATRRNGESRLRFNLVSDLSTISQIGDIVERSFVPGEKGWKVVELKEGRINEALSDILDSDEANETDIEQRVKATLGDKAVRQVRRMQRQRHRISELQRVMTTDRGSHPLLNIEISVTPDVIHTENYLDGIRAIVEASREHGVGAATIPGGIHLLGLRRDFASEYYIGGVSHTFYHMRHKDRDCGLVMDDNRAIEEWCEIEYGPFFFDLVAQNMRAQWGMPLYAWVKPEESPDLVVGDIRIFAQFDMEGFFAFAANEGVQLSWITGKPAERLKRSKLTRPIPGSPSAWGIKAVLEDGNEQTLLSGFLARAVSDLTTPRELINLIKLHPEQMRKAGMDPHEFK